MLLTPFGSPHRRRSLRINLSTRVASVYLVANDYNVAQPARLTGRASAGPSADANYRRDLHSAYIGAGNDTVNPGTVAVGGKTWLTSGGNSAGAIMNAAASAARTRADLVGATAAPWSLTVAASWATLGAGITNPRDGYGVFGIGYVLHVVAISNGSVGVVALNAAGSAYQFVALGSGAIAINDHVIIQAQSDGATARVRLRKSGSTTAWTSAACTLNAATQYGVAMGKPATFGGPAFSGEFGGAFFEQAYASDMDDVLAAFAAEVGLA